MESERLIVRADDVAEFTLPEIADTYISQCLVDPDGVGAQDLNLNRGLLRAGKRLPGGSHPPGSDECYYTLRGRALLTLGGDPHTGEGGSVREIGPDTVVYIPGGTYHALHNPFDEDFMLLTIWPKSPAPGANGIYDARKAAWGTAFRLRSSTTPV